jgi:hypothetical protein
MWMCRPGSATDACTNSDLTAIEVRRDGTFATLPFKPAEDPAFDCFYVHPTQNFDPGPGNAAIDPKTRSTRCATRRRASPRFAACSRPTTGR